MEPWLQLASDGTSKKREPLILRREVTHSRSKLTLCPPLIGLVVYPFLAN